jgi:hypothetical protein
VNQAKYTKDIVRKFKMEDSKAMTTPMSTTIALDADEEGSLVDPQSQDRRTEDGGAAASDQSDRWVLV